MKRNIRIAILLAVMLLAALAACGGQDTPDATTTAATTAAKATTTAKTTAAAPETVEAALYADFSCGSQTAVADGQFKTATVELEEVTPMALADALSEWTGLDFTLDRVKVEGPVITVDWSADSTLVAGLDDREQKDAFLFHDNVTLSWFMLDSLYMTLLANYDAEEVYYTLEGEDLAVTELYPVDVFPADIPYLGSPFYYSHTDLKGDADYSRTAGLWRLDGDVDTAYIIMDGEGAL